MEHERERLKELPEAIEAAREREKAVDADDASSTATPAKCPRSEVDAELVPKPKT